MSRNTKLGIRILKTRNSLPLQMLLDAAVNKYALNAIYSEEVLIAGM